MLGFLKMNKCNKDDGIKMKGLSIHLLGLRVHNLDLECILW